MNMRDYVAMARVDHWIKNIFVLPGVLLAALMSRTPVRSFWMQFLVGVASVCLIASANYIMNEWVDADFDRFHPVKKDRPAVRSRVSAGAVLAEYLLALVLGLILAAFVSLGFFITACAFALAGVAYNMRPFRTKERVYLDVLSESINSPLRLMLGWFIVTQAILPPSSLVFGYWMGGAFLMAVKRYSELRSIGRDDAALYRRSFRFYTEESLLISSFFYAMCCAFFIGVFLVKHRVELLLSFPFLALLFAWYMWLGMRPESAAQHPEKLYQERAFFAFCLFLTALLITLLVYDVPRLNWFLEGATIR
jgi:decaprenyl-phosphate phosphoribosyltransferase